MNNNKIKSQIKHDHPKEKRTKALLLGCTIASSFLILSSVASASDIEIYQPAVGNKKRLMLMVDQSRSMGGAGLLDLVKDYPLCIDQGVTDVLGKNGLNLGIKVAGQTDLIDVTKEATDLVNQLILKGLLGNGQGQGILDSIAEIKTEQPSTAYPFPRQSCTVVTTDATVKLLDNLLNGLLGVKTGLSAEQYIRETCDPLIDISLLKSVTNSSTVGIYRCYDKNSRVRMALTDVLKGKKGEAGLPNIDQIPDSTMVGLSVSPYNQTVNDRAGAIVFEPKLLSDTYLYNGKTQTHRQHMIDYIASANMDSKGEFNLQSLLLIVPKLINGLLNDVFATLGKILSNPLDAVSELLNLENTNNALNDVLTMLGLGGNNPMASTYAETGAYLLGNTTKGTGARQYAKRNALLGIGGISLLWTDYECNAWKADGMTCADWKYAGLLGVNTNGYKKVDGNLLNLLGILQVGKQEIFYEYRADVDAKYSGFKDSQKNNSTINPLIKTNGNFYQAPSTAPQCDANGLMVIAGGVPTIAPTLTDSLLQPQGSQSDATKVAMERLMARSLDNSQSLSVQYKDGRLNDSWGFRCNSTDLKATTLGNNKNANDNTDFATWQCIGAYARDIRALKANPIKTAVIGLDRSFLQLPEYIAGQENSSDTKGLNQISSTNVAQDQLLTGIVPKAVRDLLGTTGALLDGLLPNSLIGSGLTTGITSLLDRLLPRNPEDIKNMARWGVIGGGGWYNAANSQNIAQSIKDFHDDLGVTDGDPIGLQTLPEDPLTPYRMTNEVYKSMFEPTEKASWIGNFKKYYVENDNSVNKLKDAWDAASTTYDVQDWNKGGVLAKLKNLKNKTDNSDPTRPIITERKILINRDCQQIANTTTYQFTEVGALKTIDNKYLDVKCGSGTTSQTDAKGYLLMNLLGYNVGNAATTADLTEANRTNWQVGMNLHSTPIKLTQEATFNTDNSIKERKDYMLFGTTQGLLHVVDAKTGEETFAFVPNEMLENSQQSQAFLDKPSGVKANMAYGIDGAWTTYSEYAYGMKAMSSGSTSSEVVATVGEIKKDGKVLAKGKQMAYGGLRMGGRSYYALDLSDINQPKLKFHIDPDNNRIISLQTNGSYKTTINTALASMGQSWSKPTITTIMYKGAAKRVMLVGGGYDMEYEKVVPTITAATKGRMIYMFDADNGDLIWYAGGDSQTTSCNPDDVSYGLKMKDLYSVVSRINAVDRDGDGITDHLYFGDLGGQVWRIDLTKDFGAKVGSCGGYSVLFKDSNSRFYEAPNFSVYGYEQPLAVVSIASGNRSLPYSDKASSSTIYNLFDQDVVRRNFTASGNSTPKLLPTDLKSMLTASDLKGKNLVQVKATLPNGWYVQANSIVGKELDAQGNEVSLTNQTGSKVLSEMVVMNKSLYASVYNPNTTVGNGCKIQANGATTVQRFCLPFGVCEQDVKDVTMSFGAGHGIVDSMVGSGIGLSDKNGLTRQLLNPNAKDKIGNSKLPMNTMRRQLVPLTWYERNE
ncbi:PilC/PilY family type IV pilus protein [Acinetobacter sp. C26M]|uniref:PilC/PilY family type IV pilus protein n=1 Tax=unclassified Acinetobacter TaxID=196816 RepID=UPI002036C364|nr:MULTISPECIES: PilC/PilY family type IV pilus protein [unclassified Acinetobacter]USA46862.1 PilC/PilY family type IV pilus protein [Acinetobacter sp. C26M]USA50345.1 PilC/PilY family type IV pilus protein [Acinetobacter sp. C26G]